MNISRAIVVRRMSWLPKKIDETGSTSSWWIESLKVLGIVIMKIIAIAFKASDDDKTIAIPVAAVMKLAFGCEDLLSDSMYVTTPDTTDTRSTINFKQGKIHSIKIRIIPTATLQNRGGTLIMSIVSCTRDQFLDDFQNKATAKVSVTELLGQPNVIVKSASQPINMEWKPDPRDNAASWQLIGSETESSGIAKGGLPTFYLTIAYSDLSSDQTNLTKEYSMAEATFDVILTSDLSLRQGESKIGVRREPVTLLNSVSATIQSYSNFKDVKLADCNFIDGCLHFKHRSTSDDK